MMTSAEAYAAEIYKDEPDNFHTDEQLCETINDFIAGWRAADNSRWISVEERLPKENQSVFICNARRRYGTALYQGGEWIITREFVAINVTHWMPIVPPQRKEDKNDNI